MLMKSYKNYEKILNDIYFDGRNILIKNEDADLIYVNKYFKK